MAEATPLSCHKIELKGVKDQPAFGWHAVGAQYITQKHLLDGQMKQAKLQFRE